MGLESRSLTRMLKTMEEKGLIFKKQDPNDKRSVRIYLTPEGKEKREVSRVTVKRFNSEVRQAISDEKLKIFFDVVGDINRIIEHNNIYD